MKKFALILMFVGVCAAQQIDISQIKDGAIHVGSAAYPTIGAAYTAASAGSTIVVPPNYTESGTSTSTQSHAGVNVFFLGKATITSTACPSMNLTADTALVAAPGSVTISSSCTNGDNITIAANVAAYITGVDVNSSVAKTGGGGIHCVKCKLYMHDVWVEPTFEGIWFDGGGSGQFGQNISIGAKGTTAAAANWNHMFYAIGTNAVSYSVVTDFSSEHIVGYIDRPCAGGGCFVLDAGTDSMQFNKLEMVTQPGACRPAFGTGSTCGDAVKLQFSITAPLYLAAPRANRFIGCNIESGANDDAIHIVASDDTEFIGCTQAMGKRGLHVEQVITSPVIEGVSWLGGSIIDNGQEGVLVDGNFGGPNKVRVSYALIAGNSQLTNNTYADAKYVSGSAVSFTHNIFKLPSNLALVTNKPSYNILTASTNPVIKPNYFDAASHVSGSVSAPAGTGNQNYGDAAFDSVTSTGSTTTNFSATQTGNVHTNYTSTTASEGYKSSGDTTAVLIDDAVSSAINVRQSAVSKFSVSPAGVVTAAGFIGSGSPKLGSGSASNTDVSGELVFAAATTATYNWVNTYSSHPEVTITPQSNLGTTTAWVTYTGTTSFTINTSASFTGTITYNVLSRN